MPFSEAKPTGAPLQRSDQRKLRGQTFAKRYFIVRSTSPCLLLPLAVVVAGQPLDGSGKYRRQYGDVFGEIRPQRGSGQ